MGALSLSPKPKHTPCHICRTLLLRLLKFIVMISLCTHFVACIWYMLGCQADRCQRNTWALTASLVDSSASDADHYCSSLYWAVATMTTTGYGDISATNVQVNNYLTYVADTKE